MLQQYQAVKAQHKNCILFFRLGDFYEMFYEDAREASSILDLVLTARGKGSEHQIPMCGIPYHSADSYIAKLIKAGYKVAICEQLEDPALAQGIVKRDVIRIISSGTFLDESSADARYILCLSPDPSHFGMAFLDSNSGHIQTNQYEQAYRAIELISRLPIYECVYPLGKEDQVKEIFKHPLLKVKNIVLSPLEDWCFNPDIARKSLCEHFATLNLKGFGIDEMPAAIAGCGALLQYLKQMNKQPLRHIDKISLYADQEFVYISPAAMYGLELEHLLKTINHTLSAMGKRLLRYWLYHPLRHPAPILQRQAAVTLLKEQPDIQKKLKIFLSPIPDIEKSLSRLSCGYTSPKDILAIRNALHLLPDLRAAVHPLVEKNRLFSIEDIPELRGLLDQTLNPEMPLNNTEGKIIQKGYHRELDLLKDLLENGRQWLRNFQEQEIKRSGIHSLKVGYNKIFGYYIEITNANLKMVPADYIRKQTLVNGERFITPRLKEHEEKTLTAQDKILKIENEILLSLQRQILDYSLALHNYSQGLAVVDCLFSLTLLAQQSQFAAPRMTEKTVIDIKDGRHPVVEKSTPRTFVPNDLYLDCDDSHLMILTGPNMAGKSTYIRQTAILVILAQMGSYVPASSAEIGVVDKIFTRIGAHDDISKGQSTFMVEMTEAADIINNLTDRSLIILDEIGRGTSTYDGLSLAWAIAEYLAKTKARGLFATHFHELTALAEQFPGVKNFNVAVKEWKDEIIFLHKIIPGSTDDSYGIYVAKLAGIPAEIIQRSKRILTRLELQGQLKEKISGQQSQENQLTLFAGTPDPVLEEIREVLRNLNINELTPISALNKLVELKLKLEENKLS